MDFDDLTISYVSGHKALFSSGKNREIVWDILMLMFLQAGTAFDNVHLECCPSRVAESDLPASCW